MSPQPTHATPQDDLGQPAGAHGYHQVLHDLIGMGTDLARLLHQHAIAQAAQPAVTPQPAPAPAPAALITITVTFDRIARAVRRSILLARTLADPIQPAKDPAGHRAAARKRIIREVEDVIQRTGSGANDGRNDPETLQAELHDRIDAPDLDDDISARPVADIITEICRDLGLAAPPGGTHPWKRRTPEDIAHLCARAAAPSPAQPPAPRQAAPQPPPSSPSPSPPSPSPAAIPRIRPAPIQAGSAPPEYPAPGVATILRHPARPRSQPPPPPGA